MVNLSLHSKKKTMVDVIVYHYLIHLEIAIWYICRFTDDKVAAEGKLRQNRIVDCIGEFSFFWYWNRNIKCSFLGLFGCKTL